MGDQSWLDALNQCQLDDRADRNPGDLAAELARAGPAAVRARRRMPALLHRRAVPAKATLPAGATFAYLLAVIANRDLWMHRVDIALATGNPLAVTAAENEVVAQVVRDLDRGWTGPAFTLTLTGHGAGVSGRPGQPGRRTHRRRGRHVPHAVGAPGRPAVHGPW